MLKTLRTRTRCIHQAQLAALAHLSTNTGRIPDPSVLRFKLLMKVNEGVWTQPSSTWEESTEGYQPYSSFKHPQNVPHQTPLVPQKAAHVRKG